MIDWSVARRTTGGDDAILSDIVSLVKNQCPQLLSDIRRALETADAVLLQRSGHTLHNSAEYFGSKRVSELSRRLEMLGREGDLRDASATIKSLEEEVSRFLAAVEQFSPRKP